MGRVTKAVFSYIPTGIVLSGLLLTGLVQGAEKNIFESKQPIVVTSDKLEADNKNKTATFSGNVVSRQEQPGKDPIMIYCDSLVIYYSDGSEKKSPSNKGNKGDSKTVPDQNRVDKIVATGQVRIINGKDVATGDSAVFTNADQRFVLSGNPKVWQGKNLVKGEEITVWVKENRSLVTSKGSNRVQAVIHQEEKK